MEIPARASCEAQIAPPESPLCVIGQVTVRPGALAHRFVREIHAVTLLMQDQSETLDGGDRVAGTANSGEVELYGWAPNVGPHTDNTGFIYLAALTAGASTVSLRAGDGATLSVTLAPGVVVRLNDHFTHWTEDDVGRVCIFVGGCIEPDDAMALARIQAGIDALARGDYEGAPRCAPGFRMLAEDECLVPNADFSDCTPWLLELALADAQYYERCALCDNPAVVLDRSWPHFFQGNACRGHLHGEQAEHARQIEALIAQLGEPEGASPGRPPPDARQP